MIAVADGPSGLGYAAVFGADGTLRAWDQVSGATPAGPLPLDCPVGDACPWASVVGPNPACEATQLVLPCSDGTDRTLSRSPTRLAVQLGATSFEMGGVEDLAVGESARLVSYRGLYVALDAPCDDFELGQNTDLTFRDPWGARACACTSTADCGAGRFCDALIDWDAPRCAPSACGPTPCANGVCDPYTGACVEPGGCTSADDCPGAFCNVHTGRCIAAGECASTADCPEGRRCAVGVGCVGCLNDCDCAFGARCVDHQCLAPCDYDVFSVDPSNAAGHDTLQVCLAKDDPTALAAITSVLAGWDCGYGGLFAPCKGGVEMACYRPLPLTGGVVVPSVWDALCELSRTGKVSRIVSGAL